MRAGSVLDILGLFSLGFSAQTRTMVQSQLWSMKAIIVHAKAYGRILIRVCFCRRSVANCFVWNQDGSEMVVDADECGGEQTNGRKFCPTKTAL